jgi:hypothetical protein
LPERESLLHSENIGVNQDGKQAHYILDFFLFAFYLFLHFSILPFGKITARVAFSIRPRFFMLAGVPVALEVVAMLASISGRDIISGVLQLPGDDMLRQHRVHNFSSTLFEGTPVHEAHVAPLRERFQFLNVTDDVPGAAVAPGTQSVPDLVKRLTFFQFSNLLIF